MENLGSGEGVPGEDQAPAVVFVEMVQVDLATGATRVLSMERARGRAPRKPEFSPKDLFKAAGLLLLLGIVFPLFLSFFVWTIDRRPAFEMGGLIGAILSGVIAVVAIVDRREGGRDAIGLVMPDRPIAWLKSLGYYCLGIGATFAGIIVFALFLFSIGIAPENMEEVGRYNHETSIMFFVAVVFVAPIVEEILFRGVGLSGFLKTGSERRAVIWTSVIFAIMHGLSAPVIFFIGVTLAYIRLRAGSLYCAMAIHALHNTIVLCLRA